MKQNKWIALVFIGGMLLASCGKSDEANSETSETTEQTASSSTENTVSTANVESGKTGSGVAIAASTLKTFLPAQLGSFTADGDPETMQTKMGEWEYSVANQDYKDGDKRIQLVIADYNGVASLTAGYASLMGMSMETESEVTKGEKFNGHNGWVNYKKDNSDAQIGVAVNDRIWLLADGHNGTTIDELRAAVNSMDLSKLGSAK